MAPTLLRLSCASAGARSCRRRVRERVRGWGPRQRPSAANETRFVLSNNPERARPRPAPVPAAVPGPVLADASADGRSSAQTRAP